MNLYIKIKGHYDKYKEIINYLICGGLTTLVNFVTYIVFAKMLKLDEVLSSGLAWFVAVLFAYFVNKIFVFESKKNKLSEIIKELFAFFACRILSGIMCDVGTFALMVKVLHINDIVAKIVTQIMVIITNYVFSKWIVFEK